MEESNEGRVGWHQAHTKRICLGVEFVMWLPRIRRRMDEGRQRNTPKVNLLQGHAFDSDVALSDVLSICIFKNTSIVESGLVYLFIWGSG